MKYRLTYTVAHAIEQLGEADKIEWWTETLDFEANTDAAAIARVYLLIAALTPNRRPQLRPNVLKLEKFTPVEFT